MIMVAAHDHPLASFTGVIPKSELAKHVQLVLTDRSELTRGREFGVMSPQTWRLSDLFAKHSFLLKGLGWGVLFTVPLTGLTGVPMAKLERELDFRRLAGDMRRPLLLDTKGFLRSNHAELKAAGLTPLALVPAPGAGGG